MKINDKIKTELAKRINAAADDGFLELRMKKSNDVLIIWFDGSADDPDTVYKLKSYKLQAVIVHGLDALVREVVNYEQTKTEQQRMIVKLYDFYRQKIDTGIATAQERQWYADTYKSVFNYDPFCYA